MLLTDEQIRDIQRVIEDHHAAFVASVVGPEAIDPNLLERLKRQGLVDVKIESIQDAYLFGQVAAALETADAAKMGYQEFKSWLEKNPIPLSDVERRAIEVASQRAGQYAKGLGNRISLETGQVLINADQTLARAMRDEIENATALNIAKRQTAKQLRSDLGHRTRDWARDLDRIAITELNSAHQTGVADGIAKDHGDDSWVFKRPMPDSCDACKALHLGDDGQPLIFRLSALEANGTNVGRKKADWLPTVGSVHPHCFIEGTLVRTATGDEPIEKVGPGAMVFTGSNWQQVSHQWISAYKGEVCRIITDENEVVCTPNHLLWVDDKWQTAAVVEEGAKLRYYPREATGVIEGYEDTPADSYALFLFGVTQDKESVIVLDHEGKLYAHKGPLDALLLGPELQKGATGPASSDWVDPAFTGRFVPTQTGLLSTMQGDNRIEWIEIEHTEFSKQLSPDKYTRGPWTLQELGYRLYRTQVVDVKLCDDGGFEIIEGQKSHSAEGVEPATTIVRKVQREHYNGRVYNLTVPGPQAYVANDFLVHNCQCQLARVPDGWGFNEEGQMVPGGELGERYETTESFQERRNKQRAMRKSMATGHTNYQGIPIGIENPAGSIRTWKDVSGAEGSTRMLYAYGFVEGTEGMDGDEIDVFIGPEPDEEMVYVVSQQNPRTGIWDEDKTFVGFSSPEAALRAYRAHFDRPDFEISVSPMHIDHFRRWCAASKEGPIEPLQKAHSAPQEPREPRFVIPLEKALKTTSGSLQSDYAAQYSRQGNRAPGPGLGANHAIYTPNHGPPQALGDQGHELRPRDMLEAATKRGKARKRDKKVYEYKEPLPTALRPFEIPEWYEGDRAPDPDDVEYNKQMAVKFGTRNLQRPRNTVEVGSDASSE